MKMNSLKAVTAFGLSVLLADTAAAQAAATSKPVGYETVALAPGQFNLVGFRLVNSPAASGNGTATTATTITTDATFSLDASTTYEVEFDNGASFLAPGSDFSGSDITGLTGIDNTFETSFVVRPALTIAGIFGETNSAGLTGSANADPSEADVIFIPTDGGGFKQVFYSSFTADPAFTGWLDASTFEAAGDAAIEAAQGIFVQAKVSTTPVDLVVTGAVKTTPTAFVANDAFNIISGVYPAGSTLENSGLSNVIQGSANADPSEADLIQIPDGSGGFTVAFFSTFTADPAFSGWLDASSFAQIPGQELSAAFFIQRRGPEITGLLTPPAFYSTL